MSNIIRKVIKTSKAPAAIGPYSQGILVDKTLYISGQLGLNPESMALVGNDIEGQTKQALMNMEAILTAANTTFSNVVKVSVLLADINDFAKMNEIYSSYFKPPYPARAAYQVACLPKDARVEIEAIAVVGKVKDE